MNNSDYEDILMNLPNSIWVDMLDLHKRLSTAIPKKRRNYWVVKIDEFYRLYFINQKPP